MNLFFKIEISNDILVNQKFSTEEMDYISSLYKDDISYSDIDFDKSTFSDLIDYLEFEEPKNITFIINNYSQRLLNIIDLIKKELFLDISFELLNVNDKLNSNISKNILFKKTIDITSRLNNSYFSFHSGIYPFEENIHIKHLFLDKITSFKSLDQSIINNMSINSLLIVNSLENKEFFENGVLSKIISYEEFENINSDNKFQFKLYNDEILKKEINVFLNTGYLPYTNSFPLDYGKKYSKIKIFSLFIYNNEIYFDFSKNIPLNKNINSSIYEIINELSSNNSISYLDFEINYLNEFINTKTLSNMMKKDSIFITSLNKYKIEGNISSMNFKEWVGIIQDDKKYLFNRIQNRLFEVDENFIFIFEYLIKDKENLIQLEEYKYLLPRAKELLKL